MSFLLLLFTVHLLALMVPGPDFLIVTKTAMSVSRRAAFLTAIGVVLGVAMWASLVLLGLHLVFEKLAWLQTVVKIAGGAYLVYLGFLMLRASFGKTETTESLSAPIQMSDRAALRSGFLTNLANPKAVIYFGSIFATFLTTSTSTLDKLVMFLMVTGESLAWFWLLGFLFSLPAPRRAYQRANRWIDRIAGTAFSLFGLRLIFASAR
jgi:threonine efflux protein